MFAPLNYYVYNWYKGEYSYEIYVKFEDEHGTFS